MAHFRDIVPWQLCFFQRNSAAVPSCFSTMLDLIASRFKPQTSRTKDKSVTARSKLLSIKKLLFFSYKVSVMVESVVRLVMHIVLTGLSVSDHIDQWFPKWGPGTF